MRGGRLGALILLGATLLFPALAQGGRIFQWTDAQGNPQYTDNLFQLPDSVRQRYLELIEEQARQKYTIAQIRDLKEQGNWPPLDMIRPKKLKDTAPLKEWMGFKLLAEDAEVHRAIADEFRFQWNSFYDERKRLQELLPQKEAEVRHLEEALEKARFDDMVGARIAENQQAPKVAAALEAARKQLQQVQQQNSELPRRELALHSGQRLFFHPGEDGGPSQFGPGAR